MVEKQYPISGDLNSRNEDVINEATGDLATPSGGCFWTAGSGCSFLIVSKNKQRFLSELQSLCSIVQKVFSKQYICEIDSKTCRCTLAINLLVKVVSCV